jgi:type IV secretory pathway VirB10-like protein
MPSVEDLDAPLPASLLPAPGATRSPDYEQDKSRSLVAGSRILALSHAGDTAGGAGEGEAGASVGGARRASDVPRRLSDLLASAPELLHALPALLGSASRWLATPHPNAPAQMDAAPGTSGADEFGQKPGPSEGSPLHLSLRPTEPLILEGTPIPCVLLSEIRSDLPGMVVAQVSEDVYDSVTAQRRLIPRGTRLIGRYQSQVAAGQQRLFATFHRLILPGGASIDLQRMDAADDGGAAGVQDEVDTHFWQRFGQSFLTAGLARAAQHGDSPAGLTTSGGVLPGPSATGQILVETARASLQAGSALATTLRIRHGTRFNVMVSRDLALPEVTDP